jgi:hypothetical protein
MTESNSLKEIKDTVSSIDLNIDKLSVNVLSILSRIDTMEKMISSNTVASKRAVKTMLTVEEVEEAETSSTSKLPDAFTTTDNVINSLSFFKKIIFTKNYNNMRNDYTDLINTLKPTVKKNIVEGSEKYWTFIGGEIWKGLSKDDRQKITNIFKNWKKNFAVDTSNQLEQDNNSE